MKSIIRGVTKEEINDYKGLVVSAYENIFFNNILSGKEAIIHGAPALSISTKPLDKSAFGVISYNQSDSEFIDIDTNCSTCMWVINKDGSFEPGDIITTSGIGGYGTKQKTETLTKYSFAKINMTCDFSPILGVKKVLHLNPDGTYQKNQYGELHWTDTTELESSYDIRYIDEDGVSITKEEYDRVDGYIAALVACTLF